MHVFLLEFHEFSFARITGNHPHCMYQVIDAVLLERATHYNQTGVVLVNERARPRSVNAARGTSIDKESGGVVPKSAGGNAVTTRLFTA